MQTKRYGFHELRRLAKECGVEGWSTKNKDQLCAAMNMVRIEHEPKYVLTCTKTSEVSKWWIVSRMGKVLDINTGNIFYSLKKGIPLKVKGVPHIVEKL